MDKNSTKEDNQIQDEVTKAVIGMLKNSEGDLSEYNRTYKKKTYSYAVTHMQQAVEKFGKSIIAQIKEYTEDDLKKIDHKVVEFFIKETGIKLDEIKEINPEMERYIRELVFSKLRPDFKKQFHTKDDLYIPFDQLKMILELYDYYEELIRTGEVFLSENLPMKYALNELERTKEDIFLQLEKEYNVELTDEQKLEVMDTFQNELESEEFFQKRINTLYIILLLSYVVIMHSNLEKHQSSSRYDLEREERYHKKSELVQLLPLMSKVLKKMIDVWWYLLDINNPEIETESNNIQN